MTSTFTDADRLDLQHHSQIIHRNRNLNLRHNFGSGLRYIETGQSMHEIQKRELYKIEDFDTFEQWMDVRHQITLTQANDYMAVRDFPPDLVQDRYMTLEYLVMIKSKPEQLWRGLVQLVHERSREFLPAAVKAALKAHFRYGRTWAQAEAVLLDVGRKGKKPSYDKEHKCPTELARAAMRQLNKAGKTILKIQDHATQGKPLRGAWRQSLLDKGRDILLLIESVVAEPPPGPESL